MAHPNDAIVEGLLKELIDEDAAVTFAGDELEQARIKFEVMSQKYAAVRDVVARHLGKSPYRWEFERDEPCFPSQGRYRFIHMDPGDAVLAALRESEEPMTLDEIVRVLRGGGFRVADMTRVVNAALMRTSGVEKTDEGTYVYIPEPEALPFE